MGAAVIYLSVEDLKSITSTEFEKCADVLACKKFSRAQFAALAESAVKVNFYVFS